MEIYLNAGFLLATFIQRSTYFYRFLLFYNPLARTDAVESSLIHICNSNISRRPEILSSWTVLLLKLTEVTSPRILSHNSKRAKYLRIYAHFHQIMPIRFRIKWYIFSMFTTACFHYYTNSWVDVDSVEFNSQKVFEDNIFCKQNILQFYSGVFKYHKYFKYPSQNRHFNVVGFYLLFSSSDLFFWALFFVLWSLGLNGSSRMLDLYIFVILIFLVGREFYLREQFCYWS